MLVLALAAAVFLPSHGVLVPSESLAGVRLGDTPAQVRAAVGTQYTVCKGCDRRSWFYFKPAGWRTGETGLGVSFRRNRVSAVYTLGSPRGWRTAQGLKIGQLQERVRPLYGELRMTSCIGYSALSIRRPRAVTAIYTIEAVVSGFALTLPSEPVCQ
jgi:hypothetical protein